MFITVLHFNYSLCDVWKGLNIQLDERVSGKHERQMTLSLSLHVFVSDPDEGFQILLQIQNVLQRGRFASVSKYQEKVSVC